MILEDGIQAVKFSPLIESALEDEGLIYRCDCMENVYHVSNELLDTHSTMNAIVLIENRGFELEKARRPAGLEVR